MGRIYIRTWNTTPCMALKLTRRGNKYYEKRISRGKGKGIRSRDGMLVCNRRYVKTVYGTRGRVHEVRLKMGYRDPRLPVGGTGGGGEGEGIRESWKA